MHKNDKIIGSILAILATIGIATECTNSNKNHNDVSDTPSIVEEEDKNIMDLSDTSTSFFQKEFEYNDYIEYMNNTIPLGIFENNVKETATGITLDQPNKFASIRFNNSYYDILLADSKIVIDHFKKFNKNKCNNITLNKKGLSLDCKCEKGTYMVDKNKDGVVDECEIYEHLTCDDTELINNSIAPESCQVLMEESIKEIGKLSKIHSFAELESVDFQIIEEFKYVGYTLDGKDINIKLGKSNYEFSVSEDMTSSDEYIFLDKYKVLNKNECKQYGPIRFAMPEDCLCVKGHMIEDNDLDGIVDECARYEELTCSDYDSFFYGNSLREKETELDSEECQGMLNRSVKNLARANYDTIKIVDKISESAERVPEHEELCTNIENDSRTRKWRDKLLRKRINKHLTDFNKTKNEYDSQGLYTQNIHAKINSVFRCDSVIDFDVDYTDKAGRLIYRGRLSFAEQFNPSEGKWTDSDEKFECKVLKVADKYKNMMEVGDNCSK